MSELSDSSVGSDVSSSYHSDPDVVFRSFLASGNVLSSESADSDECRGFESTEGSEKRRPHLLHEEWNELLNTDFKGKPGHVWIYPHNVYYYMKQNYEDLMKGLCNTASGTSAVMYISDCLRNTLSIYSHRRKPSNLLFDVCLFRVRRPTLVISIQGSTAVDDDLVYYNTNLARELTKSVRSHAASNFNLVHGIFNIRDSQTQSVADTVDNWIETAKTEYQANSLNMDERRCSGVVKHFANVISKSKISLAEPGVYLAREEEVAMQKMVLEEGNSSCQREASAVNKEGYVETAAYQIIRAKLKQHGVITVTGLPGDGKTCAALMLSNEYRKLGYELLFHSSASKCDIEAVLSDDKKYICIFDDIFRYDEDTENLKSVLNLLMLHRNHLVDGKDNKFVMVFTTQVYNLWEGMKSLMDRSLFLPQTVCNLSKVKRDTSEARNLFIMQCNLHKKPLPAEADIAFVSEIGQTMSGFPFICKLFFGSDHQYTCREFFKHPIFYYQRLFDNIIKAKSNAFAALAFVFLSKGQVDLCAVEEGLVDDMIVSMLQKVVPNITVMGICNAIRRFRGVFLSSGESVVFENDVMYEAFGCSLFRLNPGVVLRNCSLEFLCDRVSSNIVLETYIDDNNVIHLSRNYHDLVAARLTNGLSKSHFKVALSHKLLQHECVAEKVLLGVKFVALESLFDEGKHFLYWAIKSDSVALMEKVLELFKKLPIGIQEQFIESCLIHGDQTDDYVLVRQGQNLSIIDGCLLLAVELKCLNLAEFLLGKGANVLTVNSEKQNVFHLACTYNQEDMIRILVAHSEESLCSVINSRDGSNLTPVMIASLNGNKEIFHLLLSLEADLYLERDSDTLLHLACEGGSQEIVENLLETIDVDLKGKDYTTPLMRAAAEGHIGVLDLLLKHNADPALKDETGDSAVHHACRGGSVQVVCRLLTCCDINIRGCNGVTPVMTAAAAGDKAIFQFLVASKADLSKSDDNNNTVVHHASQGGNCDIVKCVLSSSNINSRGEHGRTPVMMAAVSARTEVLDFLISQNADLAVTDKNNMTILHIAFDTRNADIISSIKRHVDINHRDVHGRTPLMVAAMRGNASAFHCLLENKADSSLRDYKYNTVQHLACIGGNMDIVECLLVANKDVQGANGKIPIMMAAEAGHICVVKFLIAKGVSFKEEDGNGNNLLHLACGSGDKDLVDYLLPHFNINSKGESKHTPLMIAAVYGHTDLFKFLLKKGANLRLKDRKGHTCLDLACMNNRVAIIEYMFLQYLSKPAEFERRVIEVAADYGHDQIFFRILEMRCERERAMFKHNSSILLRACKGGNIKIIQYILRHENPALNARDALGRTSLLIAAERGHADVFHQLVKEGCSIYLEDKNGNTILHAACRGSNIDIIQYILSRDDCTAMVNKKRTSDGFTPVMIWIVNSQYKEEIFRMFVDKGFDLSLTDNVGNTVLHLATKFMRSECIKYLLLKGLDMNAENKFKETPQKLTEYTYASIGSLFREFQEHGGNEW